MVPFNIKYILLYCLAVHSVEGKNAWLQTCTIKMYLIQAICENNMPRHIIAVLAFEVLYSPGLIRQEEGGDTTALWNLKGVIHNEFVSIKGPDGTEVVDCIFTVCTASYRAYQPEGDGIYVIGFTLYDVGLKHAGDFHLQQTDTTTSFTLFIYSKLL